MGFSKLIRKMTKGSSEPQSLCLVDNEKNVAITTGLDSISVMHNGKRITIKRDPDLKATIPELFNKTSRPCPPFCVQPMSIAPNVETIGELEMLDYLQQSNVNDSVLVVDARIKNWVEKGTIPGSVNIPWTSLVASEGASLSSMLRIMVKHFGVEINSQHDTINVSQALADDDIAEIFDYSQAKTLVLFCNGSWCGQTGESIKALLKLGYPAANIKYYRDGMQGWVSLGFTTTTQDAQTTSKSKARRTPRVA